MATVTVFGAVHVDVCAIPMQGSEELADRPGTVAFSVGGTGFNIAAGLVRSGISTHLFTYTSRGRLGEEFVRPSLIERGILDDFLFIDDTLPLSAFVGFFEQRDFKLGVTASAIESVNFDKEAVAKAIARSNLIVIDCNLSTRTIEQISRLSWDHNKDIAVAGVSPSKIRRYLEFELPVGAAFLLVGSNRVECESVYGSLPNDPLEWNSAALLHRFKCSNLLVSLGIHGHVSIGHQGIALFSAPSSAHESWSFGAGDALLAAHCAIVASDVSLNWTKASNLANRLVLNVLREQAATT
jgi:fructose-1-phosphate kinase PfkB-like protein